MHRSHKIFGAHGVPVVTREIEIHPLAKLRGPEQGMDHAHHFGAFVVDRRRIEVADLHVGRWSHRMRHRTCVLWKLAIAQIAHFLNALHRLGVAIPAILLVPKDRETFLEAELKPVPAGHAIAGPVMKVFVRDHAIEHHEVVVGGEICAGQHVLRVENVEALVLHRAHIEI